MNKKKLFIVALVLNTVLLAFAADICRQFLWQGLAAPGAKGPCATAVSGPEGKFGPVMEIILPGETNGWAEILDLESGRTMTQEPIDHFNFRADVIMSWIRSNGLDISCSIWPGGAACVTYDMAIVAIDGKSWERTTPDEILANPALAPASHSPRRQLVVGPNRPDTFAFRTAEGTLGMLRLAGLCEHGQGVKISYKLVNPARDARSRTWRSDEG